MNESIILVAPVFVTAISVFVLILAPIGWLRTEAAFDRFWEMERMVPVKAQPKLDARFELPGDVMIKPEKTEIEPIEAVAFDGAVWCLSCLPDHASLSDDDVIPISSYDEWGASYPLCLACGHEHKCVRLISMKES